MKRVISSRKWLILPIETVAREIHGKTLLACFAATFHDFGVIIGGKSVTRDGAGALPRGVVLEKSISPGRLRDIENLKSYGHKVAVCDEEGLLYVNPKWYEQRRLERESFDLVDYFFTWGQKHKEDTLSLLGYGDEKMVVSGNPRFDLLRDKYRKIYDDEAEKIRKRYGKIILINSNFLFVNSGNPDSKDYIDYLKRNNKITDEENEKTWRRLIDFGEKNLSYFMEMLPILSKEFPDYTIIIRPHPSELDETWIDKTEDLPNVKVVYEGNANEWITASEISIQNNCTTSIEAFALDKPAISYRPYRDDEIEFKLPNYLSYQAFNIEELVTLIRKSLGGEIKPSEDKVNRLKLAKDYIENIEGEFSSQVIMDTISRLDLPLVEAVFPLSSIFNLRSYLSKLKKIITGMSLVDIYYTKKFPGLKLAFMKEVLVDFQKMNDSFGDLEIVPVGKDSFCIYKP